MIGDIKHVKKLSDFFTCVLFTCVFSQGWKSLYCNEVYMINSIVLSVQAHVSPYVQSHTLSAYTSPYLFRLTELRFRSEKFPSTNKICSVHAEKQPWRLYDYPLWVAFFFYKKSYAVFGDQHKRIILMAYNKTTRPGNQSRVFK